MIRSVGNFLMSYNSSLFRSVMSTLNRLIVNQMLSDDAQVVFDQRNFQEIN